MNQTDHVPGLVSIVIPTYNQAAFLKHALECVLAQTYEQWEAIVINNFSQDDTIPTVESFRDPRISLVNFSNGGVIARSRNLAISEARGEFIAFLDSDDLWEPTKLEKSVRALSPNVDIVCHAERWFGGNAPDRIVAYGPVERATYESLLLNGNCVSTSATVIRREILNRLGGFRENAEFITTEDYDLWLRVAQAQCTFAFLDEVLGSFRRHLSSASSSHLKHLQAEIAVIEDHFRANSPRFDSYWKRRLAHAYYSAARACSRATLGIDGFKLFAKSLMTYPWRARTWLGLILHFLIMLKAPWNRQPSVN